MPAIIRARLMSFCDGNMQETKLLMACCGGDRRKKSCLRFEFLTGGMLIMCVSELIAYFRLLKNTPARGATLRG